MDFQDEMVNFFCLKEAFRSSNPPFPKKTNLVMVFDKRLSTKMSVRALITVNHSIKLALHHVRI